MHGSRTQYKLKTSSCSLRMQIYHISGLHYSLFFFFFLTHSAIVLHGLEVLIKMQLVQTGHKSVIPSWSAYGFADTLRWIFGQVSYMVHYLSCFCQPTVDIYKPACSALMCAPPFYSLHDPVIAIVCAGSRCCSPALFLACTWMEGWGGTISIVVETFRPILLYDIALGWLRLAAICFYAALS